MLSTELGLALNKRLYRLIKGFWLFDIGNMRSINFKQFSVGNALLHKLDRKSVV